jgi:hypothetical protein
MGIKFPMSRRKSVWSLNKVFDVVIESYVRKFLMAEIIKEENEKQSKYLNRCVVLSKS